MASLAGRRIAVTGAASGIGAALVDRLAETGAVVTGLDRYPSRAETHIELDLADPASIDAALSALPEALDGLANVAGLPGTHAPKTILRVNFLGARRITAGLQGRLRHGAAVVCVSSVTAHRCDWPTAALQAVTDAPDGEALERALAGAGDGVAAYELSKRLLNHWAAVSLPAFAAQALRLNLVSPGPVQTPILGDFEDSMGKSRIDAAAAIAGRHGAPEEIAAAIAFLLSPAASWINGVDLKVDGGFHALRAARELTVSAARDTAGPAARGG